MQYSTRRPALMSIALVVMLAGCGDDADGSGGMDASGSTSETATVSESGEESGADESSSGSSNPIPADPSPGVGSQTLEAGIDVRASGASGGPLQTEFLVTLDQVDDTPVADATITVEFDGQSRVLEPDLDSPGTYRAEVSGYAQVYAFDIERGPDTLTDVVLVGPSAHEISLDPDPAVVGQPATVSWTPHSEPEVQANILVYGLEANSTLNDGPVLDEGQYALSAEAFPEADDYVLRVDRYVRRDLSGPASFGTVRVMVDLPTTGS